METIQYRGTAFRQALDPKAPWLISFVAAAEQVLEWAGIPRRSDSALMGFQRPDEEPRVLRTRDYFNAFSMNQSPTSLVLGIHPAIDGKSAITLKLEGDSDQPIRPCVLEISYDPNEPLLQAVERLKGQIRTRLEDEVVEEVAEQDGGNDEDLELAQEAAEEAEKLQADDDQDNEEIELGRSLLQDLLMKLEDQAWCSDHEKDVRDLGKPATIIDGQH